MGKIYTAMGLMSGTSLDGVDVSIIESDGNKEFSSVLDRYFEYDKELIQKILILREKITDPEQLNKYVDEIKDLEREITLFHAEAIKETFGMTKFSVDLIGFHGQTIFHDPEKKITKQLGDGKLLSQLTKKNVVYNFRQNDLENGGQGAPLTPIFHNLVSKYINKQNQIKFPIGFINIGGISNITKVLRANGKIEENIEAFDSGPGNCLIDEWIRVNSKKKFDNDGLIAQSGKIDQLILNQAIDNFEIQSYDKSLDIKNFDTSFARGLSFEDGCATITNFTAYLIAKGIEHSNKDKSKNIKYLICGGGRKNNFLINCIKDYSSNQKNISLDIIDNYEYDGDYIESQAFAYLAIRSFLNLSISFPKTTGCNKPTVGGKMVENY